MKDFRSGVYQIRNTVTGDFYIGSSVQIHVRWSQHRRDLRAGTHHSVILQRAWNKYGEAAFEFAVLEDCPREAVVALEQEYLTAFRPLYNCSPTAAGGRAAGFKVSEETRRRMSEGMRGVPHLAARGRVREPISEETREKMAKAKRGKKGSHTGFRHSEETKARISAAKMGNRGAVGKRTPEQVERIRQGQLNRKRPGVA